MLERGAKELLRRRHAHDGDAGRRFEQRRTEKQRYVGAAQSGFARERDRGRSGRGVAQETDRIERLARRSTGDRNALAAQRAPAPQGALECLDQAILGGEPSDAALALREKTPLRIDQL